MRYFSILLLLSIVGCKNSGQADNRKTKRDSIKAYQETESYKKYTDSLHEWKFNELKRLKKQIPFSEDYYFWFEIIYSNKIDPDPDSREDYDIGIGEIPSLDLTLYNDYYMDSIGICHIKNITSGKDGVVFETISEWINDTVLWKLKFLTPDSSAGEWSYKTKHDKKFNSRGTFIPEKYFKQAEIIRNRQKSTN